MPRAPGEAWDKLRAQAERLRTAGCPVDLECEEITEDHVFAALSARQRRAAGGDSSSPPESTSWVHDVMPDDFELTYDEVNPDSRRPGTARLLITYNGRLSCDQVVVEEIRGARWSTVVVSIERHEAHTSNGYTTDVLRQLLPGDTRPFTVNVNPEGQAGEIRLRLTPTIDGRAYPPVIASCVVKPPVFPPMLWGD